MSRRRQTAVEAVEAYNQWTTSAILGYRDPSCVQEILPASLNQPVMDNNAYEAHFGAMIPLFKNLHIVVNDVFEDEQDNKVVVWARSSADSVVGPFRNEYMIAFYFNEAGDKVVRMLEFLDSAQLHEFFPRLKKFLEEKRGAQGTA